MCSKFMTILKQLHIMYAKFLKDLLTNKRKLEEVNMMALNGNCFTIMDKKMPIKLRNSRSFVIPYLLGDSVKEKALANSGSSINAMSYTIYMKLRLRELRLTRMTLQLADRLVRRTRGIVEDVLVTIEKLVFPVDFAILDIDEDVETPFILG
ncbi:uncharacterized protein LOC120268576 [Dioscorea cayenensis subsp. rotundata]|uniref:Uncharacterized protein LOC120268576 n=1 Tax=Dioscorea cayennensis subsp. rotundata TaxID=55577 RepID=A0AB40BYR9_DIOCR|nr:uncharacterized protein LOC120268576 [Dioscorea cayenensis subsp. rotundata]